MLSSVLAGSLAGTIHVVSGPDHLAALAPIAMHRSGRSTRLGLIWGLGHGLGVVVLGGLGMLVKDLLNIELISQWSELLVGFLLIVIGFWSFKQARGIKIHSHGHGHSDHDHSHYHLHGKGQNHNSPQAHAKHSHAAFYVGLLHGSAGTGHLLGVLPSLALGGVEATCYLLSYLVSAILSMGCFGLLIGILLNRRHPLVLKHSLVAASALTCLIGVVWVLQAGAALHAL